MEKIIPVNLKLLMTSFFIYLWLDQTRPVGINNDHLEQFNLCIGMYITK